MTDLPDRIAQIAKAHLGMEGPLLPILHALQAEFGHVPQVAVTVLAEVLNLGKAEVQGTLSFYHDFRSEPLRGTLVRLCRAEACQAMGGERLARDVQERLGTDWHQSSAAGAVTLEPVYCLGLCACAPAAEVGGQLVGRADVDKITSLIGAAR